jgi:hypothetical protein
MELYLPMTKNPYNGQFMKGHKPFNKGKKQSEWMDGRKRKRILKYLEIGRAKGNATMAGWNAKITLMLNDGKIIGVFKSTNDAGQKTNICSRNIRSVCCGKRKRAGGFEWQYEN